MSTMQPVRTVNIRGKAYVDVAERVRLTHAAGGYSIVSSELVTIPAAPERLWARVTIQVGDRQFVGTAEAKLSARPGTADGDSPVECAETSALGRALGFAGFGLVHSIASADEVARNTFHR